MNYRLNFSLRAERETQKVILHYENLVSGLWKDFLVSLENILGIISVNPNIYQEKRPPFREAVMKRFPFAIIYTFQKEQIIIHSVFHYKQNPDKKSE